MGHMTYSYSASDCGGHLLRDGLAVAEQEKQLWAQEMFDLLLAMTKAADHWRGQGAENIPKGECDGWIAQYFAILASGLGAYLVQAPPIGQAEPKKRGRKKQDASKNLLDALLHRAEDVLCFLDDLSVYTGLQGTEASVVSMFT